MKKLYFIISIPETFKDKFQGFLKNVNTVNDNQITIENVYKDEYVAIPKTPRKEN